MNMNTDIPIDSNVKAPKQRIKQYAPANVRKAIADYKEVYSALFKCPAPVVVWDSPYIKVDGQTGVELKIFRKRINLLKRRL